MPLPSFIIAGPTAGGKSALALALAQHFARMGRPAELITADAYQIYRGMDIGTAKPTPADRALIPHHLIDIVDPADRFTASDWLAEATRAIDNCRARSVIPIVVGGTHLYIKLLQDGLFEGPAADEPLREQLRSLAPAALREELERIDPTAAARLHPNDIRRTIRAIEVFRLTGTPISQHQSQWDAPRPANDESPEHTLIGLNWESEQINRRINSRVRSMMESGFLDEVRALHAANRFGPQSREALGYKQLLEHLEGRASLDDAVERTKIETRRFAKNQRTWLKRLRTTPNSRWLTGNDEPDLLNRWLESLSSLLNQH